MQDVHVFPKHLNDCLLLCEVAVAHKRLDVSERTGNEGQEPHERIGGSVFDDAPGERVLCPSRPDRELQQRESQTRWCTMCRP